VLYKFTRYLLITYLPLRLCERGIEGSFEEAVWSFVHWHWGTAQSKQNTFCKVHYLHCCAPMFMCYDCCSLLWQCRKLQFFDRDRDDYECSRF